MNEKKLYERISELVAEFLNEGFMFTENSGSISRTPLNIKLEKNGIFRSVRIEEEYGRFDQVIEKEIKILVLDSKFKETTFSSDSNFEIKLEENYVQLKNSNRIFSNKEMDQEELSKISKLRNERFERKQVKSKKVYNPNHKLKLRGFKSQKPEQIEITAENGLRPGFDYKRYFVRNLKTGKITIYTKYSNSTIWDKEVR